MSEHEFFVAMDRGRPDTAFAACVANNEPIVKGFFRSHAGCEIRKVKGPEMRRLIDAYLSADMDSR